LQVKIDPKLGLPESQLPDRVGASGTAATSRPAAPASQAGDQASLSSDAVRLSELSISLSSAPEIRQDRVAAVSQAIQNGTFSVSNEQIAQSMMRDFQPSKSSGA
jgi:negative regulator of flagellin synthesis FlgM